MQARPISAPKKAVINQISLGKRVPEIAMILNLSERTVRRILDGLRDDLDARENTLLVRRAFEAKLINLDEEVAA